MSIAQAMGYSGEQIFDLKSIPEERKCGNCKYWSDTEACVCAKSEQIADFTHKDLCVIVMNIRMVKLMKCPYRNFQECIVQECPSCNYEIVKKKVISGRYPHYMDTQTAIQMGCAWEETRTEYKFVSCKLIENSVQPIPEKKEIINNNQRTNVIVRKSVF